MTPATRTNFFELLQMPQSFRLDLTQLDRHYLELQARVRTMLRIKMQYDQLERMLELRQALSYMIVHDLRNPLAAVMLYLQLLKRKGGVSPEHIRYLDMATSEAQKMSSFLDDMLMLAKMERGKLSLSRSPLYVDHLLEQRDCLVVLGGDQLLAANQPFFPAPLDERSGLVGLRGRRRRRVRHRSPVSQ